MKLYEFEGHNVLAKVGLESPFFVICENLEEIEQAKNRLKFPIVAKVQVLSGKRGLRGGVKVCKNSKQLLDFANSFFNMDFDGEVVKFIGLFEAVKIESELYASLTYDTVSKNPFLLFSESGGMDIEEVKLKEPESIIRVEVDPLKGLVEKDLQKITTDKDLVDFLLRLWDAFIRYDCRLIEVNPIAKILDPASFAKRGEQVENDTKKNQDDKRGKYVALDAKVILDDNGLVRQKDLGVLPKGSSGAIPTKRELAARKIDAEDYRGSAGSTFIEFPGDIAILASGGGASLLVMDAVVAAGGSPANYTEYSGNPPREKVEKLTKIALSREGINGCLVAGAVANFTDIYETLSGFVDGLREVKPKVVYPIVIRRGGPKQKEAYEMILKFAKEDNFDVHLYGPETPISVACQEMVRLSEKFKKGKAA